jgi:hypothetical protein
MNASGSFAEQPAPVSVHTPAISQSVTNADLIVRSRDAVLKYVLSHAEAGARLSNYWIFPTGDANTVFVRYTLGDSADEHLLVVEMAGTSIVRLRDLTSESNPTKFAKAGRMSAPQR